MSEAFFRRHPEQAEPRRMRELAGRLREADALTPDLLSDVIREACWRLPSVGRTRHFDRFEQLIRSGAWTDAVLVLLELELPQWQLRRMTYDTGEWHCALSRQRELPDWLDQSIEAHHADLSLAILSAFVGAQCVCALPTRTSVPSVPCADNTAYMRLCCDNFA
jgi:hypothetical protein